VTINGATQAAVTKLDCVYPKCKSVKAFGELPKEARQFIGEIEKQTGTPVVLIGTGADALDIVDRRT
jgi:adenylosuccinate synthase